MSDELLESVRELVDWPPIGRAVRGGSWQRQAEPTPARIERALTEQRWEDAAGLVRHLVPEAEEIHELFTAWCAEIPAVLVREGADPGEVERTAVRLAADAGVEDAERGWRGFIAAAERLAIDAERGRATPEAVHAVVETWTDGHDRHLALTAAWVDVAVRELGESHLGELWRELQRDGIAQYDRYGTHRQPWSRSFALLMQIAIEGMHAHYGGPRRQGEVEVREHEDRIELRFAVCGSGGAIRAREAYGVTQARHPFAWNELGVCHYCIHCCVLQQLTPIERLGYPARVIDPPLAAGDPCLWTIYRDPELVPDVAYRRVGQEPPDRD